MQSSQKQRLPLVGDCPDDLKEYPDLPQPQTPTNAPELKSTGCLPRGFSDAGGNAATLLLADSCTHANALAPPLRCQSEVDKAQSVIFISRSVYSAQPVKLSTSSL